MIAAAQGDVVIDIEERPIVKSEVIKMQSQKCSRILTSTVFFLLIYILYFLPT